MSRADRDRLQDILGAIGAVMRYYPKLSGDDRDMAHDDIVRQLEVIGEAANRLDPDTKAKATEIEWHKIAGFRNIAIHEYFRVNQSIVEGIVSNYLPSTEAATMWRTCCRVRSLTAVGARPNRIREPVRGSTTHTPDHVTGQPHPGRDQSIPQQPRGGQ